MFVAEKKNQDRHKTGRIQTSVRLEPSLRETLENLAESLGVTMEQVIIQGICHIDALPEDRKSQLFSKSKAE